MTGGDFVNLRLVGLVEGRDEFLVGIVCRGALHIGIKSHARIPGRLPQEPTADEQARQRPRRQQQHHENQGPSKKPFH